MKDRKKEHDKNKITGFFDRDTELRGELFFKGAFRVDGYFKGTIQSDSVLIIGDQAKVEADIKVGNCIINGEIKGTVRASEKVEVHSKGRVIGTIIAPRLVVEEGAFLEANCQSGEHLSTPAEEEKKGGREQP